MLFPDYRPRRLRKNKAFRALIRETHLTPAQLIYPIFVMPGKNKREEISSMPGVFRFSVDQLAKEGKECLKLGINSVILFGLPEKKDPMGSGAHIKDGIIQRAIRELKNKVPELIVITDVCLCEYTSHGHCGIILESQVDNDTTLEVLANGLNCVSFVVKLKGLPPEAEEYFKYSMKGPPAEVPLFDQQSKIFFWRPLPQHVGTYKYEFVAEDPTGRKFSRGSGGSISSFLSRSSAIPLSMPPCMQLHASGLPRARRNPRIALISFFL